MREQGSVIQRLFFWVLPRNASPFCAEGGALRSAWEEASGPFMETEPGLLALYEEHKAEARSALLQHRHECGVCSGEISLARPDTAAEEDGSTLGEEFAYEEPSHEGNREAA